MHISIHISLEKYKDLCWLYYYDVFKKNLQYMQGLTTESSMIVKGSKRLLQFRKNEMKSTWLGNLQSFVWH
jgi:hypothetical protein